MNEADLALATRAVDGDQDALTEIVTRVQDPVYRLALRMTGRPPDAEDAVQEILIRILTRLSTFHGEAALLTWAYRIAVNHLVNHGKRPRRELLTFDTYRQDLLDGLATPAYEGPDGALLAEEIRLLCTQALLQCLDEPGRLAYVLGDIVGLSGTEAAWVLATTPATYRKRLERARRQVRDAMRDRCGLLDAAAPCWCGRRVTYALAKGRIGEGGPVYAQHPTVSESGSGGGSGGGESQWSGSRRPRGGTGGGSEARAESESGTGPGSGTGPRSGGGHTTDTRSGQGASAPERSRCRPGTEAAQRTETEHTAAGIAHLRDVGELLRSHPRYAAPQDRVDAVLALARSGAYEGLLPDTTDGP